MVNSSRGKRFKYANKTMKCRSRRQKPQKVEKFPKSRKAGQALPSTNKAEGNVKEIESDMEEREKERNNWVIVVETYRPGQIETLLTTSRIKSDGQFLGQGHGRDRKQRNWLDKKCHLTVDRSR
jgi:hypothetical protein